MDPRWWLLPPVVALCILGAYFMGQRMTPEAPAPSAEPVAQQPVIPPPAAPPRGRISVTEVPRPAPAPAAPTPAPTATPAPALATAKPEPYHRVEPPVVLPPPAAPEPSGGAGPTDTQPAPATQDSTDNAPAEPDREPLKLNEPALEYPSSAYEAGVEGAARVGFTVTAAGKIEDVRVTNSSGDPRLDQAAMDYVRRLRFRPGIRDGKPADVRVSRTVRFQLH